MARAFPAGAIPAIAFICLRRLQQYTGSVRATNQTKGMSAIVWNRVKLKQNVDGAII